MRSSPGKKGLAMSHEERKTLERWVRMPTAPQRLVLRSRIVLMLAEGCPAREIARRLGVSRPTVALWRKRYAQEGCAGLTRDRPGRGRKPSRKADMQSLVTPESDF
jgi:transposase